MPFFEDVAPMYPFFIDFPALFDKAKKLTTVEVDAAHPGWANPTKVQAPSPPGSPQVYGNFTAALHLRTHALLLGEGKISAVLAQAAPSDSPSLHFLWDVYDGARTSNGSGALAGQIEYVQNPRIAIPLLQAIAQADVPMVLVPLLLLRVNSAVYDFDSAKVTLELQGRSNIGSTPVPFEIWTRIGTQATGPSAWSKRGVQDVTGAAKGVAAGETLRVVGNGLVAWKVSP